MRCLIHSMGAWNDAKIGDEMVIPLGWPVPIIRQVIIQQRRCARCNLVQTRRA